MNAPFPPAPWRMRGRIWMGLFRADAPIRLPDGLRSAIGNRWRVVLLVRYEDGTLRYDELVLGVPARRGFRIGLFAEALWVSDAAGMWGGRRIWGLPKQMARFHWGENGTVRIEEETGFVAVLTFGGTPARVPVPWLPAPFFGRRGDVPTFTPAQVRGARLGRGGIRRADWSARFSGIGEKPILGVAASFHLIVPPPIELPV